MNQSTAKKLYKNADRILQIHANRKEYDFVIPLLDEPYKLALRILLYEGQDPVEVQERTGIHWQTVKQVRKALEL